MDFKEHYYTVEPRYNEVLGTMKIKLSRYIRFLIISQQKKNIYKELKPAKLSCYKRVLLYPTSLLRGSTVFQEFINNVKKRYTKILVF